MSFLRLSETQMRKQFEARQRAEKLKQFKENAELKLSIERQHVWGASSVEKLNKETVGLPERGRVKIIINQNLSRDTNIVWDTFGKETKLALRMGGLKPQALTSKAIKAVGQYYVESIADRKIKSRIISRLHKEKSLMLDLVQDRIAELQPLERHLGQRVNPENPSITARETLRTLDQYIRTQTLSADDEAALQRDQAEISQYYQWDKQRKFNYLRLQMIQDCIKDNLNAARELRALIKKNKANADWLQTTANLEILKFIQNSIFYSSRGVQGLNDILTHQHAWLRGDLNGYLEDAVREGHKYKLDWHTQVTVDHQLAYPDDKAVTVDSDFHTHGGEDELEKLMMTISEVSGDNSTLDVLKGPVRETAATKWRHWRKFYDSSSPYETSFFNGPGRFFGELWNTVLFFPNLIETALFGNEAKWVGKIWYHPPNDDEKVLGKTDYYALAYRIKKKTSISTKIGLELYKITHDLFAEGIGQGLYDGWKQFKRMPQDIEADFHKPFDAVTAESVLAELKAELRRIEKYDDLLLQEMGLQSQDRSGEAKEAEEELEDDLGDLDDLEALEEKREEKPEEKPKTIYYAQPKVSLARYKSHGFFSGLADGFEAFVDLLGHDGAAKNPFTVLVSAAASGLSFMAFFATPLVTKWFGSALVKFLQAQGYIWTKVPGSAAMAGAFTNFKLVAALIEGIEHGPCSWGSRAVSHLLKDPAKAVIFTGLSWSIAHYFIALNIPWISEELKSHLGDPPQLSEIFGGAKMGIVAYHLVSSPPHEREAARVNYIMHCLKNYKASEEKRGRVVTREKLEAMKCCLNRMISPQAVEQLRAKTQRARLEPKLPQENEFSLMLHLAMNNEKLSRLDHLLKAKLASLLPTMVTSKKDAKSIVKFMDPDKYGSKSTLRSFVGRAIGYVPTILRCVLSPFAWAYTQSNFRALRSWKDLGEMLLDDLTSTTHFVFRIVNKVMETLFSRIPRTFADVVVNSMLGRTLSFFGYHQLTRWAYAQSAKWDIEQEHFASITTTGAMNALARVNTTPHVNTSFEKILDDRVQASFSPSPLSALSLGRSASSPTAVRARAKSVSIEMQDLKIQHRKSF